ncbi:MAG: CIA30 family protein [Xanthomonadales bacterium]|nr:CIA30 family protein [Xanthomonadales bacterium]
MNLLFLTLAAVSGMIGLELNPQAWRTVNDGVMGGVSSGQVTASDDGLRFSGELSLENNGGFASARRPISEDLSAAQAVRISVRGDGRRYQLRLRQDGRFDGIAWRAHFETGPDWQDIEIPLAAFEPVYRGRPVPDAGKLEPARLRQLGLMLADGTPGAFHVELRAIDFLAEASSSEP